MTATAAQIAKIRLMVNEPTEASYTDEEVASIIESHPLMDELGTEPYYWDYLTVPPTQTANTYWIPTYDLNAAAAEIWEEKANIVSVDFDFNADGGSYTRSQVYEQYMKQARRYASKRSPASIRLRPFPRPYPRDIDESLP